MEKPTVVLVGDQASDGRIWGRFAAALAAEFEVRHWNLRDSDAAPEGPVDLALAMSGAEDAVVGWVGAGVAGAALLISPQPGKLVYELAEEKLTTRTHKGFKMLTALQEFEPQLSGEAGFPVADQRRMIEAMTGPLDSYLEPADVELVRQAQLAQVMLGAERGLAMRREAAEQAEADPRGEVAQPDQIDPETWLSRWPEAPWIAAAPAVIDRITVLAGVADADTSPLLTQRLPGLRVVELATQTDYPWLEQTDAVVAATRQAAGLPG